MSLQSGTVVVPTELAPPQCGSWVWSCLKRSTQEHNLRPQSSFKTSWKSAVSCLQVRKPLVSGHTSAHFNSQSHESVKRCLLLLLSLQVARIFCKCVWPKSMSSAPLWSRSSCTHGSDEPKPHIQRQRCTSNPNLLPYMTNCHIPHTSAQSCRMLILDVFPPAVPVASLSIRRASIPLWIALLKVSSHFPSGLRIFRSVSWSL